MKIRITANAKIVWKKQEFERGDVLTIRKQDWQIFEKYAVVESESEEESETDG